jgi:hypothetical protein
VSYPKKAANKHAVNAGVSFPPDIKRRVQKQAAAERKTTRRYVLDLVLEKFKQADTALENQANAQASKAKSSMKKRR